LRARGLLPDSAGALPALTLSGLNALWDALRVEAGEFGVGLRVGQRVRLETFEAFGHVLASSRSLGDACLHACRLASLATDALELSLHVDGAVATLINRPRFPAFYHPESSELIVSGMLALARQLTGRAIVPSEVHFTHGPPPSLEHHEAILWAPVRFGHTCNGCVVPTDVLHTPITRKATSSPRLDALVAAALAERPGASTLTRQVRTAIAAELPGGNPSAERIAEQLGLHPKTLSRALREEGTTHRKVLDELRLELAERYFAGGGHSIAEVASLLGYADTSAFRRAFRRRTGVPPTRYLRD
jgi:AraC-like DNA-binding protein